MGRAYSNRNPVSNIPICCEADKRVIKDTFLMQARVDKINFDVPSVIRVLCLYLFEILRSFGTCNYPELLTARLTLSLHC